MAKTGYRSPEERTGGAERSGRHEALRGDQYVCQAVLVYMPSSSLTFPITSLIWCASQAEAGAAAVIESWTSGFAAYTMTLLRSKEAEGKRYQMYQNKLLCNSQHHSAICHVLQ